MTQPYIYLDHAATTPLDPEVREAMLPFLGESYGNPSSLHRPGKAAKKAIEQARHSLRQSLGGDSNGFIFTSGGTEANNLAILGYGRLFSERQQKHLITSAIEHPCILEPSRWLESQGWSVTFLPVDSEGRIELEVLKAACRPETVLVSLMHGNNEIGTLQDIDSIGTYLQARGILFHTDAVQTVGKLPIDLATFPVDALTLSGHKLYGPKGIGALYVRPGSPQPLPLIMGGGQQDNLRSGTENVVGIVGLAKALQLSMEQQPTEALRLGKLQAFLIKAIEAAIPTAQLNGPRDLNQRVLGNVNFSFPPIGGDALVLQMDMRGIGVSSGSACHSAVIEPSHVVLALGKSVEIAQSTLRFSLGRSTTQADVDQVLAVLPGIIQRLTPGLPVPAL